MPPRLHKISQPFLYEINTWPWLEAISRNENRTIDLGSVPGHYWDEIADLGFDGVWLMVNLSEGMAAGAVRTPWTDLRGRQWQLADPTQNVAYERSGDDLVDGLFVELDAWQWHMFRIQPTLSRGVAR